MLKGQTGASMVLQMVKLPLETGIHMSIRIVLATLLLIKLPVHIPGKAMKDGPSAGALHLHGKCKCDAKLPALR